MKISDFIDIHAHILPGLDDGPERFSESLALAQCYDDVGIKKVFATPHFLPGTAWSASPKKILVAVRKLQDFLDDAGSSLTIIPGMEIAIQKRMGKNLDKGRYLPLGDSNSYLLEPPFTHPGFDLLDPIAEFLERRQQVILAHPERCEYFQRHPEMLEKAHDSGVAIQINLGSLLGWFGQQPKKTAEYLLAGKLIDFIASDAHSATRRRPPNLREWQALLEIVDPEVLRELTSTNPAKLL
ncbi:MAG: hypothetical protein KAG92_06555 [Deltaproteobacteria bacterium]|nr:hypothetical protein [Deltaproteobacteria bacterium]